MGAAAQTLINLNPSEQTIMMQLLTPLDDKIIQRVKYIMNQHGLTQGEALEYVVTNNPILWAKVYLDWEARDYQRAIVVEAKKSKKLVLRLGRRLGKCLAAGEKILNPITGEYKTVEELYKAQEHTTVLSLDTNEKKLVPSGTSIFTDNGVKDVYKLTTEYGREIRCTGNHPFWSDNQWKDLEELSVGDAITIAGDIKPPDSHHVEDWKVKHWAAEVRDGKPLPKETFLLNEEGLCGFIRYLYGNNEQMPFRNKDTAVGIQSLLLRGKQNARLYEENGCWAVQKTDTWSPLITEKITAIEYIGKQQTYDLTVPGHHNFVVNDFVTHNTDSMCVMILWFAYTQINKGPNNKYDILIMAPYETQIDLIFKRLKQLIKMSPVLDSLVTKDINHNIVITIDGIDSSILGLTAGANNSSGGANSSRGQAADIIVLDEVDYIGSTQLTNVLNIRNEAPERIRLLCASTPSGKHEEYYRWCIGASKTYRPLREDVENNTFTDYKVEEVGKGEGNGWTQIYAPSNVNKELLKINPDTEQTYLEDIRDELSQMRYVQEVMAEFGEEEMGVYQKKYIQLAVEQGKIAQWSYITSWDKETRKAYLKRTQTNYKILGIDWDKYSAATNLVAIEYDRFFKNADGMIEPKFKVLFHIEIARSDFTYVNAMERVIALNEEYDFEWIAIDRGYGEVQLEMFHKYGIENPRSGMAEKVIGYQFSEKIEVRDPYTRKKDKKPIKPFMVNNSVNVFEKGKIVLDPKDKALISQLEEYRVKSISNSGLPIYTDENEHAIDALNLALLAFEQHHSELMRRIYSSKTAFIGFLDKRDSAVAPRDLKPEIPVGFIADKSQKGDVISVIGVLGASRGRAAAKSSLKSKFSRRMF